MPRAVEGRAADAGGTSAFKDQIDAALVRRLAAAFARADPSLDVAGFRRRAGRGLDELELKARISHVAAALVELLPDDVAAAVAVVDAVLAQPAGGPDHQPAGLQGWDLWPVTEWVALVGVDHADAALELLARLTPFATGEFAIRPFIDADPTGVHRRLVGWAGREDPHVRRLVSEGTRPRLPWAPKLAISAGDPGYAVDLLDRLVDDDSEYVRRSVSNHLNDLCRVDPALALEVATQWTAQAERADAAGEHDRADRVRWVVRRGLRTAVKAGDPDALRLLGHDPDVDLVVQLVLTTPEVTLGGAAEWVLRIESREERSHQLVLDYAIHHVRSDGSRGRKVSKWTTFELGPGEVRELARRHRIVPITTRTYHAGAHLLEVQVNGVVVASGEFDLRI